MALKHGVVRGEDGTYEFFWLGRRLSLEEFNDQTHRTATSLKSEVDAIAQGMDMGAHLDSGRDSLVKLETVEGILRLPLCAQCKKLIGG